MDLGDSAPSRGHVAHLRSLVGIAALVATANREFLLRSSALPTICAQTVRPYRVVVVNDGESLTEETRLALRMLEDRTQTHVELLDNDRARGAAGAWNKGLDHLWRTGHRGFVAILDDDDTWDEDHLERNLEHSRDADLVVSGLRMKVGGRIVPRPLIEQLRDRDFLVGNPGWQGSNTFVSMDLIRATGGFRDGLASLNDRDFAIRLLRHPGARWNLTGCWTATWTLDTPGNLSSRLSDAKLLGLRRFWRLYGEEMTESERSAFFERSERLFGFGRDIIELGLSNEPESAHGSLYGRI